jgi:hypothetical protein
MVVVCEEEEEVSGGEERGRKYLPLLPSRCCPNTPSGSTAGGSAVLPLSLPFFAHSRAPGSTGACPAVVPLARSPSVRCTATLLGHVATPDWPGPPVVPPGPAVVPLGTGGTAIGTAVILQNEHKRQRAIGWPAVPTGTYTGSTAGHK